MNTQEQHISTEISLEWTFAEMCEQASADLHTTLALGYAALSDSKATPDLRAFLNPSAQEILRRNEELADKAHNNDDPVDFLKTQMIFREHLYQAIQKHGERDGMTGVFNKVAFSNYLGELMEAAKSDFDNNEMRRAEDQGVPRNQEKEHVAVFMIDLDGFKATNDYIGHGAGDAVLIEVAKKLKGIVRDSDIVGRLGGDEFAVAVRIKDENAATAIQHKIEKIFTNNAIKWPVSDKLTQAGKTLQEVEDRGFTVKGQTIQLPIRASVGMIMADLEHDAGHALEQADSMMFKQKQAHHKKDPSLKRD